MLYAQMLTEKQMDQIFAIILIKDVMLQDLLCVAPWKPKNYYIILFPLDRRGEDLNDSQGKYAWQGECDDFICIFVVIN